jgi:prominin 1
MNFLFLVGSTTEKVACEALHHPEESEIFQVLDKKFIQPFIQKQLPKSSSLHHDEIALQRFISSCHQNKTLYNLLHLKNVYDVEELKNWREEYGIGDFIASLKNKIQLDDNLRNIQILSPQAEQELLQLAESKLSDLNLTQYTQLMQEQITNLDLDMFIQKLKRVQSRLGREPQSSAVRAAIGNENLYLEQMQRVVVDLQMGIRQLRSTVELLEKDAKFDKVTMREALQGLIKQASEASKFLRTDGPELVNKLSNSYVNETIGQIDDYVFRVSNYTTNHIGRCEPLSNSFNATVVSVCNEIMDPFNGFWASIGWCYLFYLPSIALAIALVSLYRKSEPYPGPLLEVQPEDVGPPPNSKKKQRRGHRRNASEYLPDSAHYRAGYSYQDRENRFQDAAPRNYDLQQGSSASQPSGGPPRYTSNPNLAAAPDVNPEYERPSPYYYPGAAPAGGASGPGPSGAGPSNVPPPLPMPNNRS